jgi:glycosyltransferase involved in cell wall biosynthesis
MPNSPHKFVIVFNSLNVGGIETKILDLCKYYSPQKDKVIYLLLKSNSGILKKYLPKNIKVVSPKTSDILKLKTTTFPFWLAWQFHKIKPDLVLCFGNYSSICGILGKKMISQSFPLVISEDSSVIEQIKMEKFSGLRRILIKKTYPLAQKIIVLTKTGKIKLIKILQKDPKNIIVRPNWLPLYFLSAKSSTPPNRDIDILFMGRFELQKNPLKFLKIMVSLVNTLPKLKIAMVGCGSLTSEIYRFIKHHQLQNNISVFPPSTKPIVFYERSKILLLTSDHEGFPLTVLEASSVGCLPVCTKLPEFRRFFLDDSKFLLYSNKIQAKTKLKKLLLNNDLRTGLANYYQKKVLADQNKSFLETISVLQSFL